MKISGIGNEDVQEVRETAGGETETVSHAPMHKRAYTQTTLNPAKHTHTTTSVEDSHSRSFCHLLSSIASKGLSP